MMNYKNMTILRSINLLLALLLTSILAGCTEVGMGEQETYPFLCEVPRCVDGDCNSYLSQMHGKEECFFCDSFPVLPGDTADSMHKYLVKAEQGDSIAQFAAYKILLLGLNGQTDVTKAFSWLSKSAQNGYFLAMGESFEYLRECPHPSSNVKAINMLNDAWGDYRQVWAGYKLAVGYIYGNELVEPNLPLAVQILNQLVEKNYPRAHLQLSNLYRQGLGVEKDLAKSFYHVNQGAEGGDLEAMYLQALFHFKGLGTEKDEKQAVVSLLNAAKLGHQEAQEFLKKNYPNIYEKELTNE